jgi:hypothetical protein
MHSRVHAFSALITIQELEDAQYQLTLEVNCGANRPFDSHICAIAWLPLAC